MNAAAPLPPRMVLLPVNTTSGLTVLVLFLPSEQNEADSDAFH